MIHTHYYNKKNYPLLDPCLIVKECKSTNNNVFPSQHFTYSDNKI